MALHESLVQDAELSCTVLIGGKGAGKSTLARYLLNRTITTPDTNESGGVYYLDLDPGQPEFTFPGTTSVYFFPSHSTTPLFNAPPFNTSEAPLKSHWIGETSPKEDPSHYMACTADLLNTLLHHHRQDYGRNTTIIVNTPGWIKGTGMDLLQSLLALLHPHFPSTITTLFLGSGNGSAELPGLVRKLDSAQNTSANNTASDARIINLVSYFHRSSSRQWHGNRVTHASWTIRYERVPVVVVREVLRAEDLIVAINGTLVALLLVDQHATCPSLGRLVTSNGLHMVQNFGESLDPSTSRCLGLAIVHGIDLRNKTIALITPVPLDEVSASLNDEDLVICTGSIEVPIQFMTSGYTEGQERPYVTSQPGQGVGWQSWHVRRNIGRRVRNGQA